MSKKGTRALASATLMSLVLTTALAAGPVKAAQGSVTRIGAADRYATAAQVATQNWKDGAKDVVLVSGEGYADAVSASALAKQLDAPILLTTAGSLNADAKAALETLKPTNVYVVGGNASVSASVRSDLKANYTLVELQGANRYETNVAVAKKLVELGVKADNVLLVGGEGFSDALSVAPVAAAKGQILLLGNNNEDSMKSVIDFVKANSSKVTVVGTSNVISEAIYNAVGAVDRVNGGASRFDTNINVLNKFADDLKADKLFVANASGNGYADALVASALAGKSAAPLVLVDTEGTSATTNAINYIKGKATKATDLNVVGGTGVVSDSIVGLINNAVNPTVQTGDATIQGVEALNLNQVKVTFNTEVDEDSAEVISNYKLDGSDLTTGQAVAVLQDDNKSVVVTLLTERKQYDDVTFTVKKGILDEDKTNTIPEFEKELTFSDTTVPTLKSVSVKGNSKLTVEFSEAVNMKTLTDLKGKFKINGQSVSNFGLDTSSSGYSEIKDSIGTTSGAITWANKVDLYFNSPLPSGTNTLKVSDGDDNKGLLSDAAGFTFKEATMDFSVDSVTTKPVVKEVTNSGDGKIYVKFDRPMDKKTTWVLGNYELNGVKLTDSSMPVATFDFDDNDCTLKIKGLGSKINTGSNTLYIDDNVKDAYGNKVDDDTRVNFTKVKDETKPTVTSVTVIDSETIRVKFSEDVKYTYATNRSNYKLKDSKATDISDHIKNIVSSTGGTGDGDSFDIKLIKTSGTEDWRLTGSNYTLTIKNIVDTSTDSNVMDEYTATLNGSDDIAPKVTDVVKKSGTTDKDKVVIYFSEEMDADTLDNKDNYRFVNGDGDTKTLPSGASISVGGDNKSVTIEFPTTYKAITSSYVDNNENHVAAITVANVKDVAGNSIDGIAQTKYIASAVSTAATIKTESVKMYADGDDVKVDVQFTRAIDTLDIADFSINGVTPNSGTVSGDKVTLTFRDEDSATAASTLYAGATGYLSKVELVKKLAEKNVVTIAATTKTTDETGTTIAANKTAAVYDYQVAPKTTDDYWTVTANDTVDTIVGATTTASVTITFDSNLDENSGVKLDDFVFTSNDGTDLKASKVVIKNNTVKFLFNAADTDKYSTKTYSTYFSSGSKISVRAKSTVSIRTAKDADDNYATYVPSKDDLNDRVVTEGKLGTD